VTLYSEFVWLRTEANTGQLKRGEKREEVEALNRILYIPG
jgi:hypothetical protein